MNIRYIPLMLWFVTISNDVNAEPKRVTVNDHWAVVCEQLSQVFVLSHIWQYEGSVAFAETITRYRDLLINTQKTGCGQTQAEVFVEVERLATGLTEHNHHQQTIFVSVLTYQGVEFYGISNQPFR